MERFRGILLTGIGALLLSACAADTSKPLVDPVTVRLPLVASGTLDIAGTLAGQPRARDGVVYLTTEEGWLTAIVAPARQVFWRFKADHPLSVGPELGKDRILLRDDGSVLYILDRLGELLTKRPLGGTVTTAVREDSGRVFYGTEEGRALALAGDASVGRGPIWVYQGSGRVTAGPVFAGDLVLFGTSDGRLMALDQRTGISAWVFAAQGSIVADPAVDAGNIYFGTEAERFYCLDAATGRKKWSRRLQGSPLHAPLVDRWVAVACSNSVLYFLSRRGGSILTWEPIPSRVIHEPSRAGETLLLSSEGPRLLVCDLKVGKRLGDYTASGSGSWACGPVWAAPLVVGVEEDTASGRQRLVFLGAAPEGHPAVRK